MQKNSKKFFDANQNNQILYEVKIVKQMSDKVSENEKKKKK